MRLLETLQEYDFDVEYYPGAHNYIQNTLSRRPDYKKPPIPRIITHTAQLQVPQQHPQTAPEPEVHPQPPQQPPQQMLQPIVQYQLPQELVQRAPQVTKLLPIIASGVQADKWLDRLRQEYKSCTYFSDMLVALGGQDPPADDSEMKQKGRTKRARHYTLEDDGLIRQWATGKLGIPTTLRQEILQEEHDSPIGGHFGAQRTTALLQRKFYWKGLAQDVKRYVWGCAACHSAKPPNEQPYGLLQPLEIPRRRWQRINVDFIIKLPLTVPGELPTDGGNDTVITFIDALTKCAHWVAANEKGLAAERFATILIEAYFRLHGLPDVIVSDRDPRFTGGFWQHLTKL